MLVKTTKDWKQYLNPEDEDKLNQFLKIVAKYRSAYRTADDVKVAQLWSAMFELRKENEALQRRLNDLEDIFEAIYDRIKRKREEKEELLRSLEKF
jgi:predicted transcriptional regulator